MPTFEEHGNYVQLPQPKDEIIVHQKKNRWWATDPEFLIERNWNFTYTISAGETYRYNNWTSYVGVALGPVRFKLTSASQTITVTSSYVGRTFSYRGTPAAQYVRDGRTLTMLADQHDVDLVEGPDMDGSHLSRLTAFWRDSDRDRGLRFSISRSPGLEPIDYALMAIFASSGLRTPEF